MASPARSLVAIAAALLPLTSCSAPAPTPPPPAPSSTTDFLGRHGLAGLDAVQAIEKLDTMPVAQRTKAYKASIRARELIVSDGQGGQQSLPIPADRFYVSIAPYVTKTHECFYHSLTTCLGELRNVDATVRVTAKDGTVLVDKRLTTYDNGFFGLWLPRDIDGTLTVEAQGRRITAPISTHESDPTCVTTTQLV